MADFSGLDLVTGLAATVGTLVLRRSNSEAVMKPGKKVGSYFTPTSYCFPSEGGSASPDWVGPILVVKDSA
jgi:hypothetical protein